MIDVGRERDLTPGSRAQVFLDSAGSSLPMAGVVETVVAHLRREAEVGGYRAAAERVEDIETLPVAIGRLLHCAPTEIALADSATRAWSQFVTAIRWRAGDRILIGGNEYASNAIALLQRARHDGCTVEVVPGTEDGGIDLTALASMLDERVRLVSLVHVPTNSGRVAPVAQAAALAREAGALVLLDACQSVGQLDVDVAALGVDALSATGRKWLRGPRGTGFLYVRSGLIDDLEPAAADMRGATWSGPASYDLRPDAARFELWEADVAGRLGLKGAVDHLLDLGPTVVEQAVRAVAAALRAGLADLPNVTIRDHGTDLCGIVSFTVNGVRADQVRADLDAHGITVSVSAAASTRLDMTTRELDAVVRASPHYFVSEDDVDRTVTAVAALYR